MHNGNDTRGDLVVLGPKGCTAHKAISISIHGGRCRAQ